MGCNNEGVGGVYQKEHGWPVATAGLRHQTLGQGWYRDLVGGHRDYHVKVPSGRVFWRNRRFIQVSLSHINGSSFSLDGNEDMRPCLWKDMRFLLLQHRGTWKRQSPYLSCNKDVREMREVIRSLFGAPPQTLRVFEESSFWRIDFQAVIWCENLSYHTQADTTLAGAASPFSIYFLQPYTYIPQSNLTLPMRIKTHLTCYPQKIRACTLLSQSPSTLCIYIYLSFLP